jgi:hypothetical protein
MSRKNAKIIMATRLLASGHPCSSYLKLENCLETHFLTGWSNHLHTRWHNKIKIQLRNAEVNPQVIELDDGAVAVGVIDRG